MKKLSFLFAALVATCFSAHSEVLVYEGFDAGDYKLGATDCSTVSDKDLTGQTVAIGTSTAKWASMGGAQVKVFGTDYGLALPEAMADVGFTAVGGSLGFNPNEGNAAAHRAMSHALKTDVLKVSSGKLYVRVLMNIEQQAANQLSAGATLSDKDGGWFGFGMGTDIGTSYYFLRKGASDLAFVIWKNSQKELVLSLSLTDASKAVSACDLVTGVEIGETYICYAEIDVGAGADGKEIVRAGAVKNSGFLLDGALGWKDVGEIQFLTDTSYPNCMGICGPYQTKGGRYRADEFIVGTELADILFAGERLILGAPVATSIGADSIAVSSRVRLFGDETSGTVKFYIGTSEDDFAEVADSEKTISEEGTISQTITGLAADTTYYVKVAGTDNEGTAVESQIRSFTTLGRPQFGGVPSVTGTVADGLVASVDVTRIGTSDTTMKTLMGKAADELVVVVSEAITETGTYSMMLTEGFTYGDTIYVAFEMESKLGDETILVRSETAAFGIPGTAVWTNGDGDNKWENPNNWDIGVVPNEKIVAAIFRKKGETVRFETELQDITVKKIQPQNNYNGVQNTYVTNLFAFPATTTMTINEAYGTANNYQYFRLESGNLHFLSTVDIGYNTGCSAFLYGGAMTVDGLFTHSGDYGGTVAISNATLNANGGYTKAARQYTRLYLYDGARLNTTAFKDSTVLDGGKTQWGMDLVSTGAVMTATSIELTGAGTQFVIDGGAVTNTGTMSICNNSGTPEGFTVKNGGVYRQSGNTVMKTKGGAAKIIVANGGYYELAGQLAMGTGDDGCGEWNTANFIVSNATAKVASIVAPGDVRYIASDYIRVLGDGGNKVAELESTGDIVVGANSIAAANVRSKPTYLVVSNGIVKVGATLFTGDSDGVPAARSDAQNTVLVTGEKSKVEAKNLKANNRGKVKIVFPKSGFEADELIKVEQKAILGANTTMELDVSNWRGGSQVVLQASEIIGLTDDYKANRITITDSKQRQAKLKYLTEQKDDGSIKTVGIRVSLSCGMTLIVK